MLQASTTTIPYWTQVQQGILLVAIVLSVLVARRVAGSEHRWGAVLRRRFVLGVPWGTVLTIVGVVSTYLFLQGGWSHPRNPVIVAFRSWSYFYPLGVLSASFTHTGLNHLIGNMLGTVVFAPIVEYAWGHYPEERGSQTFASLRTNPFARILAVPAVVAVVGLLTSMFTVGWVIGFSGVVFAFMGFAFVTRPRTAVLALIASDVVNLAFNAFRNPDVTAEPSPRFVQPWFADVAVQGHAIGLFIGVALAIAYLRRRDQTPSGIWLWFAALVFVVSETLWALFIPLGANTYWLFRALGLAAMFVLAAIIVAAVRSSDRPLSRRIGLGRREAAVGVFFIILLTTGAMAVPFNLSTISGTPELEDNQKVEVRDYTVTYVEGVTNQYTSVFNFTEFLGVTEVRSSGIVVYSERRNVWLESVTKGQLAFRGFNSVTVGGLGWRTEVYARRIGWSAVGNGSTYKVFLRHEDRDAELAYVADPVLAEPRVDGRTFQFRPVRRGFEVAVLRDNVTLGRSRLPAPGNMTTVGGVTLNRTNGDLYAIRNDTRVKVANKVVPRAQQDN